MEKSAGVNEVCCIKRYVRTSPITLPDITLQNKNVGYVKDREPHSPFLMKESMQFTLSWTYANVQLASTWRPSLSMSQLYPDWEREEATFGQLRLQEDT